MQPTHEMTAGFLNEPKITLDEARAIFPGRPDLTTVWRWCVYGHAGHKLDHERAGRRVYTSAGAVARFKAALLAAESERFARSNSPRRTIPAIPATRSEHRRQRDQAAARAKLEAAGI